MEETKFIWMDGKFVAWKDAKIHVLTHTLHYGAGVFEGIRFYKTDKGPAIFRLKDHIERMYRSADCIKMKIPFSKEDFIKAVIETVKKNKVDAGYIRPICFFGYTLLISFVCALLLRCFLLPFPKPSFFFYI